jgi:hypothetical protein
VSSEDKENWFDSDGYNPYMQDQDHLVEANSLECGCG